MNARPISGWAACARCLYGDLRGELCAAPAAQRLYAQRAVSTDEARAGFCGRGAVLHVYRPAAAGAPALLQAA